MGSFVRRVMVLSILLFLIPISISAEESIEVTVTYGVNGKVQVGKGFPMTVKIKNEGDAITGDLVFFAGPNYNMLGNNVVPVELSKGEESVITLASPGFNDYYSYYPTNKKEQFIKFFEGGWERGKEIKLKGNTNLMPSIFPDNRLVIGALTDSPDSLNALKASRYNGEATEFLTITEDNIANESTALEVFDVILINNYNASKLSDEQIIAIKEWVRAGGHLMLGSDPSLQQHKGLQELFLLQINDQTSFENLEFLNSTKDSEKGEIPNFSQVEINKGILVEDTQVLYADHSLPMVMTKNYGLGEVTQFSFDVGSDTLIKWDSYPSFWSEFLQKAVDKDLSGQQLYMLEELSSRLGNVVEMYPSSFIPVKALVILFVLYLVLVIPGLYFLLKKIDKREISWIIIPAVSILSSIAIFIVGANDRLEGTQINNISLLSIDEEGMANGFSAFSILTNSGGDYPITIKPIEYQPLPINNYGFDDTSSFSEYPMIEKGRKQTKITFTNVEYWSTRSAMGPIQGIESGKLNTDLQIVDNKMLGFVTNSLQVDLEEVYLLSGSRVYELGKLKAGETVEVNIEINNKNNEMQNLIGAPRTSIASSLYPGHNSSPYGGSAGPKDKESLTEWKKFEMLDTLMTYDIHQKDLNRPLIAGYTSKSMTEVVSTSKQADINALTLFTQQVDVQIKSLKGGEFVLKSESMTPKLSIVSNTGFIHYNGLLYAENFVDVENGKYQLTYQIPVQINMDNISLRNLLVRLSSGNGNSFQIYNAKEKEYITLDDNRVTFEENVNEFITDEGEIIITFEKNNDTDPQVYVPTLELKGEYDHD
ncbi:DUF7408 domain-containing protein [Ornithinibacillus bavariensis]|uniref:DUF7408 domain-containing protein n=1 Tax=Ornithinibacillus bavariensis TaxID=545502 RepID=A0A919X845_9BACI|nr:hypothetical protein [Ornithinibacillus bavariensis]GIO26280.1 hypothetical protein J43TS3_08910 [Ornithinibacillus bavariensis]